jgi:hypothetical protein
VGGGVSRRKGERPRAERAERWSLRACGHWRRMIAMRAVGRSRLADGGMGGAAASAMAEEMPREGYEQAREWGWWRCLVARGAASRR